MDSFFDFLGLGEEFGSSNPPLEGDSPKLPVLPSSPINSLSSGGSSLFSEFFTTSDSAAVEQPAPLADEAANLNLADLRAKTQGELQAFLDRFTPRLKNARRNFVARVSNELGIERASERELAEINRLIHGIESANSAQDAASDLTMKFSDWKKEWQRQRQR
jgi:hypothetical protein